MDQRTYPAINQIKHLRYRQYGYMTGLRVFRRSTCWGSIYLMLGFTTGPLDILDPVQLILQPPRCSGCHEVAFNGYHFIAMVNYKFLKTFPLALLLPLSLL